MPRAQIGLFGGTFDPPHLRYLIAKEKSLAWFRSWENPLPTQSSETLDHTLRKRVWSKVSEKGE